MDFSNGGSSGLDDGKSSNHFTSNNKAQLEGSNEECDITVAVEKTRMLEIATNAMRELVVLMNTNEPLWTKSSSDLVGFVLVHERYANMFPRVTYLEIPKEIHIESSKDSKIMPINGMQLVEIILDSEKWANTFPTIVSEAKTIKVFDVGSSVNRSGALQLMNAETHILLPLLPSKEFSFLRYCQQVDIGTWVIVDVSLPPFGPLNDVLWRCPSGCMIREMSDGTSMVTWVEHVVVDERIYRNQMYRSFIQKHIAYGARKWLLELERKCEKNICTSINYVQRHDKEIITSEGRKIVMNLSNQMVQNLCRALNTESCLLQTLEEINTNEPDFLIRHITIQLQGRDRMVLTCITSVPFLVSPHDLFYFLNDDNNRHKWDPISGEDSIDELAHISIGANVACNYVSIIKTFNKRGKIILYLKESCIDNLGAYVMYAPISERRANMILSGVDFSTEPIIPSGFMISQYNREVVETSSIENATSSRGSLLTIAFQMFYPHVETTTPSRQHVAFVTHHVLSTIQKIKVAFES